MSPWDHSNVNCVHEKGGVYIITFNTGQQNSLFYIGVTTWKFKERFKSNYLVSS